MPIDPYFMVQRRHPPAEEGKSGIIFPGRFTNAAPVIVTPVPGDVTLTLGTKFGVTLTL